MQLLDAEATALALPWNRLLTAIDQVLADLRAGGVHCPTRTVLPITDHDLWMLMPAWSRGADVAACKLITVHHDNPARGLPLIQGDVIVIRASSGQRLALLDGPTVTGRRTAAVSLHALRALLARRGPLPPRGLSALVIGAGVQGRSHVEALLATLPVSRLWIQSRGRASAERLAADAAAMGAGTTVEAVDSAAGPAAAADLILLCTPAGDHCLRVPPKAGALVAAVGAYTAGMAEITPEIVRGFGGNILLDTADARHEAGDLLQAGVAVDGLPTLQDGLDDDRIDPRASVLFKSCGSALWDLAAAMTVASAENDWARTRLL